MAPQTCRLPRLSAPPLRISLPRTGNSSQTAVPAACGAPDCLHRTFPRRNGMPAQMIFTPIMLTHLAAALAAILAGAFTLAARKGTRLHRFSGRLWVGLMLVAVLSSFVIRTSGHFSWIHLLSIFTLLVIGRALLAVRRGNVRVHRYAM